MRNIIKNIWFKTHLFGMYITPYMWVYRPNILVWFYLLIILSWKLNNNRCLISQLEYYIFNETFQGKGKKYFVPCFHRYILYINFFICSTFVLFCLKEWTNASLTLLSIVWFSKRIFKYYHFYHFVPQYSCFFNYFFISILTMNYS